MGKRNYKKICTTHTALSFFGYFDSRCLRWRGRDGCWKGWKRTKSRLRRKKTAPIAHTVSCSSTSGWIAFMGVFRTQYIAEVGGYRFVGFVRIWTKNERFGGPKAKWNTWNTRNTWNTWNTFCGCSDCFFVNISKNLVANLRMECTEGNTNRECSFFLGGMVEWRALFSLNATKAGNHIRF